jgi:hypothetical protein
MISLVLTLIVCVIIWLLYAFGILGRTGDIAVPQLR